ncbi:hypothetical protein GCM10009634_74740 [Saccharothrix xinjiangensis]
MSPPPPRRPPDTADLPWGSAHSGGAPTPHDPGPPTEYLPLLGTLPRPTPAADHDRDRERAAASEALRHKQDPNIDYLGFLDRVLHGLRHL